MDSGQSSSVFYRPEKYDVLVYDPVLGEIRMNACGKGEKDLFRQKFGLHVFKDEDFFPGTGKFTLEPLRSDGEASLVCADVEGMEWIRLKEIQFFWGGPEKEIEIRKASLSTSAFTSSSSSSINSTFGFSITDLLFRTRYWKHECECRPSSLLGIHIDRASELLHQTICNGQTQSRAEITAC